MKTKQDQNRVVIFDTTLRDGEQCPGASMGLSEKLEVARQLERLNVDIIEAGFPIASPGDFEAVHEIAKAIQGPTICALARTIEKDIVCAGKALVPAKQRRIHTFSSGSDIHLSQMMRVSRDENIIRSVKAVKLAKTFTSDVEYSAQDTTRSDRDYLVDLYTAVAEAGATTLNIPDTVGYAIPDEYAELIAYLVERVNVPGLVFSVHCHNDLGMAVANSLAAVKAGARQIECTINGLGERAGNTSLEEVVMAIHTRSTSLKNVWTGVNTKEIIRSSRLVSRMTGFVVQRNKAIVGANAFAHESGIHQDGVLKHRQTYEIMRPEDVGLTGSELVLGKHSGRHGLAARLKQLGYTVKPEELETLYARFIELADKKKNVYDDDIVSLLHAEDLQGPQAFALDYLHVSTGTVLPTATVRLKKGSTVFGPASACGDGPVDAMFKAIDLITKVPGTLLDYSIQAVTKGEDAVGEVSVSVRFGGSLVVAKGASTDIVEASAKAYLNSLNRHLFEKSQGVPKKIKAQPRGVQP